MKIIAKLAKEVFDSGKAIGFKTSVKDVTGWLKSHPKGVGEQLGNALSGKAKSINDMLVKGDLYDKFFAHIDDIAKQYPDATVQFAAKNAKKGGYKIAKIQVKNGDKTLLSEAASIAKDGAIAIWLISPSNWLAIDIPLVASGPIALTVAVVATLAREYIKL